MAFLSSIWYFFLSPPNGVRAARKMVKRIHKRLLRLIFNPTYWAAVDYFHMDDEEEEKIVSLLRFNALAMTQLMLDFAADSVHNPDQRELYRETKNCLISEFLATLQPDDDEEGDGDAGWRQMVAIQYEQLRQTHDALKDQLPDPKLINNWVLVTTLNTYINIREKEPDSEDDLFELLYNTFGEMSSDVLDPVISELKRI